MNALQIPAAAESSSAHQGQISDAAEIDLRRVAAAQVIPCLLYTSDAADDS